jgi:cobalt-precorrin-5B (C1)-methyltransferase
LRKKGLRSGYTTGACAAAAAKAATLILLSAGDRGEGRVGIPLPDGARADFTIHDSGFNSHDDAAWASVIKDAGDDPDVTNGAEIRADIKIISETSGLVIKGGKGVGVMTKPGLSMPVGEAAINPVPRKMITSAVQEALQSKDRGDLSPASLEVTISVPRGEELAKKTLNHRLGIVGGISILGTTGIVRPLSTEAWTASITAAMDVAKATHNKEVVLSAGRMSEKAHMKKYGLPEEAYVMMGDYLEFSLLDAKKHLFDKIHLCAQWAKMLKIAMSTPQTHVRHGAINVAKAVELLNRLGIVVPPDREFNTAREVLDYITATHRHSPSLLAKVCAAGRMYAQEIAGIPVISHLVSYEGEIIAESE